jgi:large conductance mechanosensitive channel
MGKVNSYSADARPDWLWTRKNEFKTWDFSQGGTMLKGFRDFVLRGNVVDLAVAVVIGVAFTAVVGSVVENFITPLIALAGGVPDFSQIRTGPFLWGNILNDVLTFLITAAVVYFFIVLPVNRLMEGSRPSEPEPQTTRSCPECLSDIPVAARRCAYCTAEVGPESTPAPQQV